MADASPQGRILLVDDHPDTLELQAILLRQQGYEVRTATDARAAMALAGEHPPDLVVSDIRLPDRDGFALMGELHRAYGLRGIALSGQAEDGDAARGVEVGFVRYLVKPITPEALLEAIREVLAAPGN